MPLARPSARALLATTATLATTVAGLALAPVASANPTGTGLVISEVYGAGGNSGAAYNADFVELYNPTAGAISLNGLSIHYRAATGGSGGSPFALAGSVAAGGHFLIQMSSAGATGAALPTPDATALPAFSMAAAGGQTYLLNGVTAITSTGNTVGNAAIVDMVGLGTSTSFETAAGPAATAASSANRNASGADSDNNSSDFTLAAPSPENGGGSTPVVTEAAIAEIQGAGASVSPLLGQTVKTQGVVTAVYPTGGFNGFYAQTAGTGGDTDATPGASDGIFVFGSAALAAADPHVGDLVQVTAPVTEFSGMTELTPASDGVVVLPDAHDPVTALVTDYPTTEAGREAHEGELVSPTDHFVVTNNFTTNQFGEIGLATGDTQLWQPTDVADAQDSAAIAAVVADNAARAVTLDDASSLNFLNAANTGTPLPWLTPDNPVRIGSVATLHQPVVLDYRNSAWKLQPTAQVTDDGSAVATFSDTRTPNQAPAAVGGDVRIGALNVLNYFNTTGTAWVNAGGGHVCTYFNDRTGDPVTDNSCTPNGPRGAAESTGGTDLTDPDADLERQRSKIVKAINTLDADVVSLEEVENSVALGEADRDDALAALVDALNADAGTTRWAFAPSPDAAHLPDLAEQDVIRTAFIYDPQTIELVGDSVVLVGASAFGNAREPLAQAFKRKGALTADAFLVVANHFKSKGSGVDDGTGQGNANPDRIAQAEALLTFADQVASDRGTSKVFLTGDFNSYTREDPVQVLEAGGYTNLESDDPADTSYQFGGMAGSLDHVFANADALATVTGFDQWRINAEESVGFEYSRYNYNATLLWQDNLFRASDHNPELVGVDLPFTRESSLTDSSVTPTSVSLEGGSVTIDSTVTGGEIVPTGTVEYWLGDTKLGESVLDGSGATTFTSGPFHVLGSTTVEIRYLGDTTHDASSDSVTFDVTLAEATVHATATPGSVEVRNGTVRIDVTVDSPGPTPTGTVQYLIGGSRVASSTLAPDGTTSAVLGPFSTAGDVPVEVRYLGDGSTTAASDTVTVAVTKTATTTTLRLSRSTVQVTAGTTTATARVSSRLGAAGGTVDFLVDGAVVATATLADGRASAVLGPFGIVGGSTVEARYAGTAVLAASSASAPLTVVKATPWMSVGTQPNRVVVRQTRVRVSVSLTAPGHTVSGSVTVTAGGVTYPATLVDGKATVTLQPFTSTGRKQIAVSYGGDELDLPVNRTVVVQVVR